jgi:hypothetical protein
MRKQLAEETAKETAKETEAEELKIEVERLKAINMEYYTQAATFSRQYEHQQALTKEKTMRETNRDRIAETMTQMDGQLLYALSRQLKLTVRFDGRLAGEAEQLPESHQSHTEQEGQTG